MGEQLPLRYDGRSYDEALWDRVLVAIREIVSFVGVKQVAYDLDVQASGLVNALAERDRHSLKLEWLPYFIRKAPNDDLLAALAETRGRELAPRKELTAAEKLERLEATLADQLGPELRRAVLSKAYGGKP